MAYPSANLPRLTFRLSNELRAQLEEAARGNNRSLNAEIVARLERTFDEASSPPMITLHESELRRLIAEYMDGKGKN